MTIIINEATTEDKTIPVSIISIGGSGVGKSTIGNILLSGKPTTPFTSNPGSESCTKHATTLHSNNIIYTDVPGIPDTDPCMTRDYYNICIDEIKKERSVILFVFKYERINVESYKMAGLLFREINKANCAKFLVINDSANYSFTDPPSDEDYGKLCVSIQTHTKVDFDGVFLANSRSSLTQVVPEILREIRNAECQPIASPHLRDFEELSAWVTDLQVKQNYLETVVAEKKAALQSVQTDRNALRARVIGGAFLSLPVLALLFGIQLCGVPVLPQIAARNAGKSLVWEPYRQLRVHNGAAKLLSTQVSVGKENLDAVAVELKEAAQHFDDLKRAVHMAEDE